MTSERYRKINALVDYLLETPADNRAALLDEACAGDPSLRGEVERVFQAHESQGDFLEAPLLELIAGDIAGQATAREFSGQVLGDYEIVSRLGAGGIGEVWLARDKRLERHVAVKLLLPKFVRDPHQALRFKNEARTASQLSHPNIVTIFEIGESQGLDFIAQEFVEGCTIRQRLANGPLPLTALLDIGTQVIAALGAAHQAGIIHRDIKPENIMIRHDGLLKVLDFGLARVVEGPGKQNSLLVAGQSLTVPGMVLGTVRYMSPEHARGLPLDARSDIFSFGAVLYEMATGTPPFSGPTTADTLTSILLNDPPDMAGLAPNLPAEFERIVRRCLMKDREQRYSDAESLRMELKTLADRIAVSERLRPVRTKRRRSRVNVPVLVVAAIVGLAVTTVPFLRRQPRGEPSAFPITPTKISRLPLGGVVLDAAIAPDGRQLAYVRKDEAGESIWLTDLATSNEVRQIASEPGGHSGLTFSPDGRYLYYLRTLASEENLYRLDMNGTNQPVKVLDQIRGDIALSPDGQELAFVRSDGSRLETVLAVAHADGRNPYTIATCRRPQYFSQFGLAWSRDKRWIACFAGSSAGVSSEAFHAELVRVADGWRKPVAAKNWNWVGSAAWPAGTDTLLVNGSDAVRYDLFQIWKVSLKNGAYFKATNDLSSYTRLRLTKDGKILSAMQSERFASLWVKSNQRIGTASQVPTGNIYGLEDLATLPGGRIAYTADAGEYRNIWITDSSGGKTTEVTFGAEDKSEVSATRDGRYLLYQSAGKIWRVDPDGRNARQLTDGALDVHPTASADGRQVIYVSFRGWSPGTGGMPSLWAVPIEGGKAVQLDSRPLSYPQVSPDGKWILCSYYPKGDPRFSPRQAAVVSAHGGGFRLLNGMPDVSGDVTWTPDGKGVSFGRTLRGVTNIWQQPVDGGPATQVTNFAEDGIVTHRWATDGKQLVIARGKDVSNVVLLQNF
ncbi:MAG TPA: protein kinase [Bryobacteraceae bacterium]|jgi:serine/threonine protein kinase|nr:protein kinase [Bryobacteraceae bacterium]